MNEEEAKNNVLLIYDLTDIGIKIFKGKLTDKELEIAKKAHGLYINISYEDEKEKAAENFYNILEPEGEIEKGLINSERLQEINKPQKIGGDFTIILFGFVC